MKGEVIMGVVNMFLLQKAFNFGDNVWRPLITVQHTDELFEGERGKWWIGCSCDEVQTVSNY